MDRPGDGHWPAAGAHGPGSRGGPLGSGGRRDLVAHRHRAARDDVPGPGQGPLRQARLGHRRPGDAGRVAGAQLGRRPGADVQPRVAAAAGPPGLPDRADHRRPRALHRDGHHLERPRLRRPRGGGRPRGPQLGLPGHRLRGARLVLPRGPARLVGAGRRRPRRLGVADRQVRARLSRRAAPAGLALPDLRRARPRPRVVRVDLPAPRRPLGTDRPALHDRGAVRPPGRPGHQPSTRRGPDRAATAGLLRPDVGRRLPARPRARHVVRPHHHARLHRCRQQLRARDRRRHRDLRRDLRPGPGRRRRPAHRGAGAGRLVYVSLALRHRFADPASLVQEDVR